MWIKHHSWRQLFCTHLLTLKICVATIAICFLGHPVEMPPVLAAALASSCSTRCTVPKKHQLQSPQRLGEGSLDSPSSKYSTHKVEVTATLRRSIVKPAKYSVYHWNLPPLLFTRLESITTQIHYVQCLIYTT